jgi:hypothetical protein
MVIGTRLVGSPGGPRFCVITSATYLAAEIYALVEPTDTHAFLTRTKILIDNHAAMVSIIVLLVLRIWLISRRLNVVLR